MKGEVTPKQISGLEDIFELNRDNAKIKQMREDVEAYEDAVQKQAALAEQARLKGREATELDNKSKSIKGKPIQTDNCKKLKLRTIFIDKPYLSFQGLSLSLHISSIYCYSLNRTDMEPERINRIKVVV